MMFISKLHYLSLNLSKAGLLSLWLIMVCFANAHAQLSEEELLQLLDKSPIKYYDSIYYELFRSVLYGGGELTIAKQYALAAYRYSREFNHLFLEAKSGRALGMLNSRLGDSDSAQYYYYQCISISEKNSYSDLLVYATNDLGQYYENQDRYDSALKYYQISLEIATKLKMKEDMAFTLNNMGIVFYYLNNYKEALQYLDAAVELKKIEKLNSLYVSLMNIALVYNDQGRYGDALKLLEEVESVYVKDCSPYQLAELYLDFGYANLFLEDYKKSYSNFVRACKFAQESGNRKALANTLHYLGVFYLRHENYSQAQKYLDASLEIAEELNLRRIKRDVYAAFQNLYNAQDNLVKVIEYQNKYISIKDSIFNEQVAFNIAVLQLEAQKKQSDLVIQQKEAELQRSQMIIALVVIIAVLLVLVVWLFYKRFRLNKRLRQVLEKQVRLRTSDLVQNNYELKQVNAEFETLLKQTSKYIRGPLATLIGLIELVEKDQGDPERTQEYIARIKKIAGSMGLSMDQLKEVGRIRENKNEFDNSSTSTLEELLNTK